MSLRMIFSAVSLLAAGAVGVGGAVGCSGAPGSPDDQLPENTGAVSARLESVPADVQCIEITTTDYRTPYVAIPVVPGQSVTLRVAPLSVGYVGIAGAAYDRPCYGHGGFDGGGPYGHPTWEAQRIWVDVRAGATQSARLVFRQPGAVDLDIDFDNCGGADGGWLTCPTPDGGPWPIPDGGPWPYDGGGPWPSDGGGPWPHDGGNPWPRDAGGPRPPGT